MKFAVLKRFVQVVGVLKKHHILHLLFELNPSNGWIARAARRVRRGWRAVPLQTVGGVGT